MRKRKTAKAKQAAADGSDAATPWTTAAATLQKRPTAVAAAAAAQGFKPEHKEPAERMAWEQPASAAAAVLALVYCHHAAVRLLSPQTGEWLAVSFCSLALFAIALVAAVAGHATDEAVAAVRAATAGSSSTTNISTGTGSVAAALGWISASLAALLLAVRLQGGSLMGLAGSWLLAPGLADDSTLRISDAELTLHCMALAAVTCGTLFASLGFAAGAGASAALRSTLPAGRRAALLLAVLTGTAAWSLLRGLPPALVPPQPASSLPPVISAAAALVAAALLPTAFPDPPSAVATKQKRKRGTSTSRAGFNWWLGAAGMALVAMVALAQLGVDWHGGAAAQELEGGRYHVLWQVEVAGGGQLAVIEGIFREQYRYRLLRLDHSVLGGEYVEPAEVAGQTIFTAFYLQQAAVLLRPNGTRSLHVGLGVGTAVKAMQRIGVAADSLELHPEVLAAAQRYFGLQPALHGGRTLVGDAAELVPRLQREGAAARYDYILHDVFSGGGTTGSLMDARFFRQLSRLLAPDGVLAVNYYGGKGQGLKQVWCRLRLIFDSVRVFSDVDKARVRNHVLFASQSDLAAANLTEAVRAVQAATSARYSASGGAEEMADPLQLQVWRGLLHQEIKLLYNRQRCQHMLTWHDGLPAGRPGGGNGRASPGGQLKGQPPLLWRKAKEMRERHALATAHWVVVRTQFADSLWLS